jgi:acetyltransferase-like isoleucine patch superfamily enzyme
MSWIAKLRRGEGRFWGSLKWLARKCLSFHIPVVGLTRPLFKALYGLHVAVREFLLWALRFFWYEPLFRSQCETVGEGFRMEALPYLQGKGKIALGRGVRLSGKPAFAFSSRSGQAPELVVGDGTFIGHQCAFHVASSIRIGSHCLLAGGVRVYDMDGHPLDADRRRAGEPTPPEGIAPVAIGDDVWIGAGSLVLKGVTISDRVVVAAGSVVTKDVPPDVVVAGNPARIVKHLAGLAAAERSRAADEVLSSAAELCSELALAEGGASRGPS